MNLSHAYGTMPPEDKAVRLLNHALDVGVSFLDTAAIYGEGANERLLGKAVMHRRSEFTLASKCPLDIVDGKRVIDARPETILATLDRALDRLRTDHIDLYYLHRPDRSVPIEDSVGALARARAAGKIGAIGLSEMSAEEIRRAHATHPIAAVQSEYSPCVRNPEIAVLETCRELGIGFVAFSARPISWRGKPHTVLAVADIRTRKAAEARIRHLAFHDPLTGIANRTLFLSSLEEAVDTRDVRGGELAVLCFDLDRFKVINDVYGHATGDELLRHVASQIRECCDQDAVAARLGGDEFALMYRAPDAATGSSSLARRLLARLNRPVTLGDHSIRPSASVGIALIPRDAGDAATAMRHADLALYRAKADGRGGYRFFEPAMDAVARAGAELEADLRQAIARDELFVDYQPLAGLESGKIEGFEALVRWQHPTRGLIMPDQFIPVAEDSGLIVELGEWVLNRTCTDAVEWDPPLRLSVNVSPAQFVYADVCATIEQVLRRTGLPAARLELEITEGVLIADPARGLAMLERIRATGVQIVMDDFGTGYSSLSYFRQFPFDKVKIDRSFIQDMLHNKHARSIVEAIISLGRGLNLKVVAEGVETAEQLAELQAQGCGQAQGYYISRPMPIDQFEGSVLRESSILAAKAARSA